MKKERVHTQYSRLNRNLFTQVYTTKQIAEEPDFNEAMLMWLHRKKWTIKELAEAMNYSRQQIVRVFTNDSDMTIRFALKLGEVTDLPGTIWIVKYMDTYY